MRRLAILFALMLFWMTASAQTENSDIKILDLNRSFSVGGKAIACQQKNKKLGPEDYANLTWTLENKHLDGMNFITLDVRDASDGTIYAYKTWYNGELIKMVVRGGKPMGYMVYDDMFIHLRIILGEKDDDVIFLYSELLPK